MTFLHPQVAARNTDASVSVFTDPDEVFRILFNLMSNAIAVANRKASSLTSLTLHIGREGSTVTTRLVDDGSGLPAAVRARLFGMQERRSATPRHGYGLAIARSSPSETAPRSRSCPAARARPLR